LKANPAKPTAAVEAKRSFNLDFFDFAEGRRSQVRLCVRGRDSAREYLDTVRKWECFHDRGVHSANRFSRLDSQAAANRRRDRSLRDEAHESGNVGCNISVCGRHGVVVV
jgi:hypothetical protein